jgi:hypothetical protein
MAHFAKIDENNIVVDVLVVPNEEEHRGEEYLNEIGFTGRWIQTSYNRRIRKNYAGVGYSYNEELDVFLPPKIFESWILNSELIEWVPPIDIPNDPNFIYNWNEENNNWDSMPVPKVEDINS